MAFTVTARHSGNSVITAGQTLATDLMTPTADSLLLVFSAAQNAQHTTTQVVQAPTGGGWTYTQLEVSAQVPWNASNDFALKGAAFTAPVGGSPGAHTVTVDHYTGTNTAYYAAVAADVTGHDAGAPFVNSAVNAASHTGGDAHAGTVTLDAAPTAGNLIVVAFLCSADTGGGFASPTAGAGNTFTQLFNQATNWVQGGLWYRVADGDESATITCSDLGQAVGNYAAVAVEIAADAGGPPPALAFVRPVQAPYAW